MSNILEPQSFRDSIPTVDQKGKRVWIYPRKPHSGKRSSPDALNLYNLRSWLSWFLLAILFGGPFIRINGNPLLMMNVVERKFSIFGVMFWPQDLYLLALMMVAGLLALVLFTAVFGRIWCGWLCPQTVLMELVFRKIEYWIEGDAEEKRQLDEGEWTAEKVRKKTFKTIVFFALSFLIANMLLAYVIGSDTLIGIVTDHPKNHTKGFVSILIFTFIFYLIFSRFREQACTFVCPYGRVQSVLLDENTVVVAYDHVRGEGRGRKKRGQSWDERKASGLGDCVDCRLCVSVCPTGIDIRNGTQMECVNCTACIDACNSVMHRIERKPGLIRYASENNIKEGKSLKFTGRMAGYTFVLAALLTVLTVLLFNRTPIETDILRVPGTWYQTQNDGRITNMFNARVVNKTHNHQTGVFTLVSPPGQIQFAENRLSLPPHEEAQTILIVSLDPESVQGKKTDIRIGLEVDGVILQERKTTFLSPTRKPKPPRNDLP